MELNVKKREDRLEVSLEGLEKVYVLNTEEIKEELNWCLSIYHTNLVINLKGVKFVDTAGFNLLIELYHEYKDHDKELLLKNVSADVQELLELMNVDKHFKWNSDIETSVSNAA